MSVSTNFPTDSLVLKTSIIFNAKLLILISLQLIYDCSNLHTFICQVQMYADWTSMKPMFCACQVTLDLDKNCLKELDFTAKT